MLPAERKSGRENNHSWMISQDLSTIAQKTYLSGSAVKLA
jgi:hypothetical protein